MVPPHARGCTLVSGEYIVKEVGSPARAGMHPEVRLRDGERRRFPRTRGDAPLDGTGANQWYAVPPHARGCTPGTFGYMCWQQGSPARAGMHPAGSRRSTSPTGFPRTRGDAPLSLGGSVTLNTVPPHARGCTPACRGCAGVSSGSPARAGMHPERGQ